MKVLVTAPWNAERLAELRAAFPDLDMVITRDPAEQTAHIADAEIVFGHLKREVFNAARNLKWIQCHGAGVEWAADIPELAESGVLLTNTRGAHAQTIAEHTFGMLVAMARGFKSLFAAQDRHEWLRPLEVRPVGLSGMTLGVVGLGNIGRAIAKRGWAFDMRVIAVDANQLPRPEYVEELRQLDGLHDLLAQADVVVVATPYTEETAGMIGAKQLALMKSSAYLLVVSRGGILDEPALIEALRGGRLAGAGLDVQSREPLPADDPLWDAPNLFLTPHCSGQSTQTTAIATGIFRENLGRYWAGQPLDNLVDVRRGY